MTFLAPIWIAAAIVAAGAVVVLHLFARRRPPQHMLPTARFIPAHSAQATTRTVRPTDLLLLMLRVLLLLALGTGLAHPVLAPRREASMRIALADISRGTTSLEALRQRLPVSNQPNTLVIPFDSAPYPALTDERVIDRRTDARGSLSAALLAALDVRRKLRTRVDSLELTIVSSLREEEIDQATMAIRALWPGRITVERLAGDSAGVSTASIEVRAPANDPVLAAVQLHTARGGTRRVRIVRNGMQASDTAWASDSGRLLIDWPAQTVALSGNMRQPVDTAVAVVAGRAVVVAPFIRTVAPAVGVVVARWADGSPAAAERAVGNGCVRHVAIPMPAMGDLTLRPEFARFMGELTAPCASRVVSRAVSDSVVAALRGTGALASAASSSLESARSLAPWFFAVALLLVFLEPFVRRQRALT